MAKKDKSFNDEQRELEAKEAKKKLKAAEKQKPEKEKKSKSDSDKKKSRRFVRWFRDFRRETKRITWPDFKAVMKGTGVVIMTIIVVGTLVWVVDFFLSESIRLARNAAQGTVTEQNDDNDNDGLFDFDFEAPEIPDHLLDDNDNDNDEAPADENEANDNDDNDVEAEAEENDAEAGEETEDDTNDE